MTDTVEITAVKTIYVAWTNQDLTEGKGLPIPAAICDELATALRLGKGKGPMGSNCYIKKAVAVRIDNQWLVPGQITPPTKDDKEKQKWLCSKEAAMKKAKNFGLSEDEIKAIRYD